MTKEMKAIIPYAGIPIIALALLLVRMKQTAPLVLLWLVLIIVFGYVGAILDIKTKRIPNGLVLTMFAAWVVTITPYLFLETEAAVELLMDSVLGFAFGGGLFLFVYLISRKGLGGGDVKFMAAAGMYLGFSGAIPTMLYGTILAGLTGLVLILLKRIGRKDTMPLAPFLYAGILIVVFFQQ